MSVGRREGGAQEELFIVAEELRSTGSPFYRALNRVLAEGGFEGVCEEACRVYKYGNHLTPGLAEVSASGCGLHLLPG